MSVRRKFVVGNWKMNGSRQFAAVLMAKVAAELRGIDVDVAMCVPFTLQEHAVRLTEGSGLQIGAQDVSACEDGAFTGEVSASMLRDIGSRLVIVGHSERRARHRETDEDIGKKARLALVHGLTPVVCVGETLQQRESGKTQQVVLKQLDAMIESLGSERFNRLVVAYEPVWAIGTGRSATAAQVQEVHGAIRARLTFTRGELASRTRILYGGSVKPDTAEALFSEPDIDGALVGGASLVADEFLAIARAGARHCMRVSA